MKKVFILLGFALLGGGSFGEVLSNGPTNGPTNGNAYECRVYDGTKSVPVEMVFVAGGTLANSGGTAIAVQGFYIGKYEVTQKQWLDVMGSFPVTQDCGSGDNYPVCHVSWSDAQEFIVKLNAMMGGGSFRLPTEAEWEYAAGGGSSQQSYTYAGSNTINNVAWYSDNSAVNGTFQVHAKGTKAANSIGVYDMSGNIYEWCQDYYEFYADSKGEEAIPVPTPTSSSDRVRRGGSWIDGATRCTVSYRSRSNQDNRNINYGFRLVYSSNP
jgi:formylglycine-generating enzyme required for sulfatase activity